MNFNTLSHGYYRCLDSFDVSIGMELEIVKVSLLYDLDDVFIDEDTSFVSVGLDIAYLLTAVSPFYLSVVAADKCLRRKIFDVLKKVISLPILVDEVQNVG